MSTDNKNTEFHWVLCQSYHASVISVTLLVPTRYTRFSQVCLHFRFIHAVTL